MNVMDQISLYQIARMAYGSREHESGGRGIMGVLKDPVTGKTRIVKYDTHFFAWSSANANDATQLKMANDLRKELLALAASAGLSNEAIGAIREKLGLSREQAETDGRTLLSRKVVAQVVSMIDGDVWQKAFAGVDAATYSTRHQDDTSYRQTVTGNHGEQTAANRSFSGRNRVQTLARQVFEGGARPMSEIKATFQAAGLDVSLLFPDAALEFLDTIDDCPTFGPGDQGAADRRRVYAQVLNLCARRLDEPEGPQRQAIERDIRYIVDSVREGVVDPLPFGLGERTSSFSAAQMSRLNRDLAPRENEMSEDLNKFIGRYRATIYEDACRGMGLTVNGHVINEVGAQYGGTEDDLVNVYKQAFTGPDGRFDELGFRLSFRLTHQGMSGIALFPDMNAGMRPEDLVYSPTGSCLSGTKDAELGVRRKWGFVVDRRVEGDVSVRYTLRKENMVSVSRKNLAQYGNVPFERLRSGQRALNTSQNYEQVDVVYGHRYGENGGYRLDGVQATSTYKYDQTLTDGEVAEVNGDKADNIVRALLARENLVAQEMAPIFTEDDFYSKRYDFDGNDFKSWLAQNKDAVVQTFRDLALGKQAAFDAFADSPERDQVRVVGIRSNKTVMKMIAWLYAKAKGESPEKLRRAEVEKIIVTLVNCAARARRQVDKFYSDAELRLIWDNLRRAPFDRIQALHQAAKDRSFSTQEGAEWLKEELDKYFRL